MIKMEIPKRIEIILITEIQKNTRKYLTTTIGMTDIEAIGTNKEIL